MVLIRQQELCSGMNILQPLTIHTSIQIRPLVAIRKLIQMYVLLAHSALPLSTGTEVFKPCQPLLCSSSNRSCTQVVTFLYGSLSCCSGTAPEGKAKGDYQSSQRTQNLQNKLGSELSACSLWEWFSWFLLPVRGLFVLFDSGLDACIGGR